MNKASTSPLPKKSDKSSKEEMSFVTAIAGVIAGAKIRRQEWADEEEHCLLRDTWLSIYRNGKFHVWQVSEGDLLAKDWVIVK